MFYQKRRDVLCVVQADVEKNTVDDFAAFKMEDVYYDDNEIVERALKHRVWILQNRDQLWDIDGIKKLPSYKSEILKAYKDKALRSVSSATLRGKTGKARDTAKQQLVLQQVNKDNGSTQKNL